MKAYIILSWLQSYPALACGITGTACKLADEDLWGTRNVDAVPVLPHLAHQAHRKGGMVCLHINSLQIWALSCLWGNRSGAPDGKDGWGLHLSSSSTGSKLWDEGWHRAGWRQRQWTDCLWGAVVHGMVKSHIKVSAGSCLQPCMLWWWMTQGNSYSGVWFEQV